MTDWDAEADVVVVGAGAAGYAAAIAAARGGATVILLEKAEKPGGTTSKSGGTIWVPNNTWMRESGLEDSREDALRYIARLAFPHRYHADSPTLGLEPEDFELIVALVDRGAEAIDALVDAEAIHFIVRRTPDGEVMAPLPDYQADLPENKRILGRALAPGIPAGVTLPDLAAPEEFHIGVGGSVLIGTLRLAADKLGVDLRTGHRVRDVVVEDGRVVGVETDSPAEAQRIRARGGVVFATGGFLHNPKLRRDHLRGPVFGGAAAATATGDFIAIATKVGAQLGNMTLGWWDQMVLDMAVKGAPTVQDVFYPFGDSVIQVNKYGHRVVNEKQPYSERAQVHFHYNPSKREYSNLVMLQIYDDAVAQNPLQWAYRGLTPMPGESVDYVVSGDTLEQLADAIDRKLEAYAPYIGGARLAPDFVTELRRTIERFNAFALQGKDEDFHRGESPIQLHIQGTSRPGIPNRTMAPLSDRGPYHCMLLVAGALDTKGGPRVNARAEVVDTAGEPIPGLYGAGNCISAPTAQAYPGGGATLGSALTFGYLAGRHAAESVASVR